MSNFIKRVVFMGLAAFLLSTTQLAAQTLTIQPAAGTYTDVVGASVNGFSFTATGGTAPYTFTLASGTFVPGNILNPNGAVTGTNTTAGTFSYVIRVTDSRSLTATAAYTDIITAAVPTMPVWMMLLLTVSVGFVALRSFRNSRQAV